VQTILCPGRRLSEGWLEGRFYGLVARNVTHLYKPLLPSNHIIVYQDVIVPPCRWRKLILRSEKPC